MTEKEKPTKSDNDDTFEVIQALLRQMMRARTDSDAFGEMNLRLKWERGIVTEWRIHEETIAKPPFKNRKKTKGA